jgi:hypothetical protein
MAHPRGGAVRAKPAIPPAGEHRDSRWDVVERVCNSAQFRRSVRLRQLLVYLCHRAWTEASEDIREHEIGVDVFDRSKPYDPSEETIVRVQASQLRKRLEQYFAEEGRDEQRILDIPKGAYIPAVRERPVAVITVASEPAAAPPPHTNRTLVAVLSGLCIFLAASCAILLYRQTVSTHEHQAGPTVRKFWSAFSADGRQTFVVIADAAFSAVQDTLRRPIELNEYVRREYKAELDRPDLSPDRKDMAGYLMERRYTSLADVMFIRRLTLASVLDPAKTTIVFSRDHTLRAFQEGNHVLLGSRRAVPWVDLFNDSLDFRFVYDEATRRLVVENRRPANGEPKRFALAKQGASGGESFSLIACLPNLANTGYVLILSGQEASGTEAAGNLLTTEALLQNLLARLPAKPEGELPYFEALLRTRHMDYTSQGFELLALHLH